MNAQEGNQHQTDLGHQQAREQRDAKLPVRRQPRHQQLCRGQREQRDERDRDGGDARALQSDCAGLAVHCAGTR
jgi:hypothetical protein